MKILIIEDDKDSASFMAKGLKNSGHVTDHAADGEDGLEFACHGDYDVCVVDRMLPKMDGLTLVERLRTEGVDMPILFLSALGEVDDRFQRLEASRNSPGTGLGLSLVRAVARLHCAELVMEDNLPGLRVRLCFPKARQEKPRENREGRAP